MNRGISPIVAVALAAFAFVPAANAATEVATYKDWRVLVADTPDGKVCFAVSQPTESKYSKEVRGRDPAYFQVTTAPAKGVRNEASSIVGYKFAANAAVSANIDGAEFKMFLNATAPDTAWAVFETEAALVEAMKKGTKLTVTGTSSRDTLVTDSYSLSGISAAIEKVATECP